MQNQDKIQDTCEKVVPLGQEYDLEIMQDVQLNVGEDEEHSNVSSIHHGEICEQSEKLEDACKEANNEQVMEMNRVEVRDIGEEKGEEVGPRERLNNHRNEVSGRVWIPEMWGKEDSLKDWIDCSSFDACLVRQDIMSARASMIEEARRNSSSSIRVQNSQVINL